MGNLLNRLFFSLFLVLASSMAWSLEKVLVLYPKVTVDAIGPGVVVPLVKLARIIAEENERKDLEKLPVSLAEFVETRQVTLKELQVALSRMPGLEEFKIVGPEAVLVEHRSEPVNVDKMLEEALISLSRYAAETWPTQYRNLEFSFVGQQHRLPLSEGSHWSFDMSDLKSLRRRLSVWLEVRNGSQIERVPLWFQAEGEVMVWKSIHSLASKTGAGGMQFITDWVGLEETDPVSLAAPSENRRLTVAMRAGEILTLDHLEPVPEVEYGSDVRIILYSGNIALTTEATAMRTARAGERVAFKSKSSEEEFEALVIARNLAQVGSPSSEGE
jgi:flagella basal body P-ring formation protein FlgA